MKSILVPVDFSKTSIEAFKFALALAKTIKAQIIVLHVIEFPAMFDPFGGQAFVIDPTLYDQIGQDAEKRFSKIKSKYAQNFKQKISFSTEIGSVASMINQYIDLNRPESVIMGTQGATGMKEFFVGSNTEKIVRFSKAPVFTIRKSVEISTLKNIVFPTTGELNQTDFIKRLRAIQDLLGATLHILYVNTPSTFISDGVLKDYAKYYKLTNYTLNIRTNRHEQDGIIDFVHEKNAGLIAMATHGRKGLAHLVSGSVTEDVVNHIDCPIWTYALKKAK